MAKPHYVTGYRQLVGLLTLRFPFDQRRAMSQAVGGDFESIGVREKNLLLQLGLGPTDRLIDVGCGSGRLAQALGDMPDLQYLGTDVVPKLLRYAKRRSPKNWKFEISTDLTIPVEDDWADMIVFFSVLTHLKPEESIAYLLEAKRAVKPGGYIVISFLEYGIDAHWNIFMNAVARLPKARRVMNSFFSSADIEVWSRRLALDLVSIKRGDNPFIETEEGLTQFGQSVAVLRKPGA